MAISVAATGSSTTTVSRSPAITFSSYTPATGDIVVFFAATLNASAVSTNPTGWTNPLGSGVTVTSDSNTQVCVYRAVTTGEVTGGTTAYTATNLWNAAQSGNANGVVLRGVDSTTPVDSANSAFSSVDTATPHTLPALTGANLSTNSLVVASVAKDGGGSYTTPSGWTQRIANINNFAHYTYTRNTLTTAGTDITATNITPNVGDEYCSISVAFTEGVTIPVGSSSGAYTWSGSASGSTLPKASASGGYTFSGSATGDSPPNRGAASGSYTFAGAAAGVRPQKGNASGSYSFSGSASGAKTPVGAAHISYTFTGAAEGETLDSGYVSGTYGWSGDTFGKVINHGAASGSYGWVGRGWARLTHFSPDRVLVVVAEDRTTVVGPEDRVLIVLEDDRTITVPAEERGLTVGIP
jgi:hypothetical protein